MGPHPTEDTARLRPFSVGDWLYEPRACRLSRGGSVVKIRPQLLVRATTPSLEALKAVSIGDARRDHGRRFEEAVAHYAARSK